MQLLNKVAVIIGGTSGIGREIALGFVKAGATVVVASRSAKRVQETESLLYSLGNKGHGQALDVSSKADVEKFMQDVAERYGRIDILINSAGFFPITKAAAISENEWNDVVKINLSGAFWCAQAAAVYMQRQRSGRIIFITSGQGLVGIPLMAHYSAAKGGVIALARALAAEWGEFNITVNTIAPGPTMTEHIEKDFPAAFLEQARKGIPLQRLGKADDCVGLALLLASEAGGYITGVTVPVDGGTVVTKL